MAWNLPPTKHDNDELSAAEVNSIVSGIPLWAGDVDANGNKLVGLGTPSATGDATNKDYVDTGLAAKANTSHGHVISDTTGLQAELDDKSDIGHGHAISDTTGLQTALDGKAPSSHTHGVSDLTATGTKDTTTFLRGDNQWAVPPGGGGGISNLVEDVTPQLGGDLDPNGHAVGAASEADLTKLSQVTASSAELNHVAGVTSAIQTQLNGKAASGHGHAISDVSGLQTALDAKLPTNTPFSKTIIVESPTASENLGFWFVKYATTVTRLNAVCVGSTPSVTWTIRHSTDRSAAGNEVKTGGTTTTSTTTGSEETTFDDPTIPAGSWVWLETTAASGTITSLTVAIEYTED